MKTSPTIGFITPPIWFELALAEFPQVVQEPVRVQQAPLLLPGFDYQLDSIASVQEHLNLCAQCLKEMQCDLVAQVGTPFAWAGTKSESEARKRSDVMSRAANVPCIMTGLAIVDALRALRVKNIAVCCPYYESDWRDHFASFLQSCNFNVLQASNLSDLGLAKSGTPLKNYWSMPNDLLIQSILAVVETSPTAEAIVIPGTAIRTLSILSEMESQIKRPIVAADTILYWAIAHHLGLTLKPNMGTFTQLKL